MELACGTVRSVFEGLGEPEEVLARAVDSRGSRRKSNTHVHLPPNFSAFDSVDAAVRLAAEQGISVLGATNYYHFGVYRDFALQTRAQRIFPLFGTEIITLADDLAQANVRVNDPGNPGRMYVCGKGITVFDPPTPEAGGLLQDIRDRDSARMAAMAAKMMELFQAAGFDAPLDESAIKSRMMQRHHSPSESVYLQERHIAQAYQEILSELLDRDDRTRLLAQVYGGEPAADADDVVSTQNELRANLMKAGKPAYVPETFVGFEDAYRLILALGGIPCYPTLADGAKPICEFEQSPEELVEKVLGRGIYCAEFIPIRNQPDVLARYVRAMRSAGIVVTAGTEHNTLDLLPIDPRCVGSQPIPEEVADIFWEGTCVVAAHMYLASKGRPGFVDESGRPNAGYATAEERIRACRTLGSAAIRDYIDTFESARPDYSH